MAINEIKKLSKLDKNQLDAEVKNKMQDLIDMKKARTDIIILPSSYEILEKYNFEKEVEELKNMEQKAGVSSDDSMETLRAYDGWEKAYTGYIYNGSGSIVATYTLTELPPIVPPYNLILIDVECTDTGGFSAWSWTEATY